jgi:hypothetical protein
MAASYVFTEMRDIGGEASRQFTTSVGLALPLARVGGLAGDAGNGPARPGILVGRHGVAVARLGQFGVYSHELDRQHWALNWPADLDEWSHDVLADDKFVVVDRVSAGLLLCDWGTGQLVQTVRCRGVVKVAGDDGLLINRPDKGDMCCVSWQNEIRWCRPGRAGLAAAASHRFLVTEEGNRVLRCLDSQSGEVLWHFRARPLASRPSEIQWTTIPPGLPSVVIVGDRVFVYPMTGDTYILALETGEILADFRLPHQGLRATTQTTIVSMTPKGLSEFDHREMRELDHLDYWEAVEPLYKGQRPTATAFTLTRESVVWAASHGALMGVSRRAGPDGRRATWLEELPGTAMPIAIGPVVYGDYLYWVDIRPPYGVMCFRSTAPN